MDEKRKLLMIDDDVQLCNAVKTKLEKTGKYQLAYSDKGSQVLRLIREHQPELVILDIEMPDMPGDEVAELIRESPQTRETPILFLSCVVTPGDVAASGGIIGGRQMASKQMTVGDLIKRIESLL